MINLAGERHLHKKETIPLYLSLKRSHRFLGLPLFTVPFKLNLDWWQRQSSVFSWNLRIHPLWGHSYFVRPPFHHLLEFERISSSAF